MGRAMSDVRCGIGCTTWLPDSTGQLGVKGAVLRGYRAAWCEGCSFEGFRGRTMSFRHDQSTILGFGVL
jgi:hypothetical protein